MKNFFKATVFIAILLILLAILSTIFAQVNTANGMATIGIVGEKENTIDYLIIGDSEAYSSFVPMNIYREYGYTGYVKGTPGQKMFKTYNFLETALKNQSPKIVILETNAIYRDYKMISDLTDKFQNLFSIVENHDRWKSFVNKNQVETWNDKNKGYVYSDVIKPAKNKKYMSEDKKSKKIAEKNVKYLEKMINLCKKNNIKFVFVSAPNFKNWNYQKHNGIEKLAKKYEVDYFDMNVSNAAQIDWLVDSRDKGDHLNYSGAKKVTEILGEYICEMNLLEDHRMDEKYSDWNEIAKEIDYESMGN